MNKALSRQREILRRIAARLTARRPLCRVPTLFLLTADERKIDWIAAVKALPRGAAIIVRARDPKHREALTRHVLRAARPRGIMTLVAADPYLASRAGADGVHLPEERTARLPAIARAKPRWLITCSAHGTGGLVAAKRLGAHAILLSPMFATQSHPAGLSLGPVRWAGFRRGLNIPTIALGGISAANALHALSVGADGLALIGSWIEES